MFLEKTVLAPKSSQRKSYIIHNIEAKRETMNKSISIQNLYFVFHSHRMAYSCYDRKRLRKIRTDIIAKFI